MKKRARDLENTLHAGEILKQVQHDRLFFVTLNPFQGRKGGVYRLQPCDSESSSE